MKRLSTISVFSLLILYYAALTYAGGYSEKEQFLDDSNHLIKTLAQTLKHELMAALKTGDLGAAVHTCHISAPTITENLNASNTTTIKRTSLKWRNPNNKPDSWERAVLAKFAQQLDNGVAIEKLRFTEVIKSEEQTTYRHIKAIKTQDICLVCHGPRDSLSDEIKQVLAEKYPDDLATGFSAGQLRGAFSITRTITN